LEPVLTSSAVSVAATAFVIIFVIDVD